MLLCLNRPRRVELVRRLVWNLWRRFNEASPHHPVFFYIHLHILMRKHVYKENFTHWHAQARKSISIFDINICTYIQIIYLYLYIINIYTYSQHVHGHWSGHSLWRECTPCHQGKLPALNPQCSPYLKSEYAWWCPATTPCNMVWTCLHLGSQQYDHMSKGACGLRRKKGALGCLLKLFNICNKHVVWPRNK